MNVNIPEQGVSNEEKRDKVRSRYQNASAEGLEVIPAKPKVDFYDDKRAMRVAVYHLFCHGLKFCQLYFRSCFLSRLLKCHRQNKVQLTLLFLPLTAQFVFQGQ